MLNVELLFLSFCLVTGMRYSAAGKTQYQIQNGPCSYTFLLPEQDNCQSENSNYPVQKDGPTDQEDSAQRLEQLEITMENNTQWLLKVKLFSDHNKYKLRDMMLRISHTSYTHCNITLFGKNHSGALS